MSSAVPKVVSVEVVPAQPTETDSAMIAQFAAETKRSMPQTAFIVKVRLAEIPPATARGWALYVGGTRIPKYWEYPGGIYFKVLDKEFLAEHRRERLRFSENGTDFIDTGVRLPDPEASRAKRAAVARLPLQSEALESVPAPAARGRAVRKRARPARAKAPSTARKRKARK
jgi:hypothetical protein